jgi:two-component system chemotaxis response regulator CheY
MEIAPSVRLTQDGCRPYGRDVAAFHREAVPTLAPLKIPTMVTTLIVDDSADTRAWLRNKLSGLGCTVVGEAENAAQGVLQFEALRPRLVTLDLVMPDVDGITAIELFRRISREDAEVAVLVVSARPWSDSHEFLKLGAIGYLEKPFVDFARVAKLLRAYFPELAGMDGGKKRGLASRLTHRS